MVYENDDLKKEKPNHISYKEYKKRLETNPNEGIILFVSAFFVMLLLFLGVVKQLSPDVDVAIGEDSSKIEETAGGEIDNRLKLIQMEDNSYTNGTDETFSPELDEKVRLPKEKRKTVGEQEGEAEVIVLEKTPKPAINTEVEKPVTENASAIPVPAVNAKVIVGYYATAAQAEVAKGIIQDAGLNIQPFVKSIGAAYTLQVGSFSSREKAQSVANELLRNNFPARVIIE